MSEKYPVALAPAAVGYPEVFGVIASFLAPWMMGSIIARTAGSFSQAFIAFALVEVLLLVGLIELTWGVQRRPIGNHL